MNGRNGQGSPGIGAAALEADAVGHTAFLHPEPVVEVQIDLCEQLPPLSLRQVLRPHGRVMLGYGGGYVNASA